MRHATLSLAQAEMARDVRAGLSASPKTLPSRYFYDDQGSKLFQQIMNLPEYYLTRCEYEILDRQGEAIARHFFEGQEAPLLLVEFGAGDGLKTSRLLGHCLRQEGDFSYLPVDISGGALAELKARMQRELPALSLEPVEAEYFEALRQINRRHAQPKVILFLGSNIGNFRQEEALHFLQNLRAACRPGDRLFIGFDLKKDPDLILRAYNDAEKVTRAFNFNLLTRLNRELGANFDLSKFRHYPAYDPLSGETRSYLISTRPQEVHFQSLGWSVQFEAWEPIWTELSQKFDRRMILDLAARSGFAVDAWFSDSRQFFSDVLWRAV